MDNRVVVIFEIVNRKERVDLDLPLDITANELVYALNKAYDLQIDMNDNTNCYFQMENPIALLKGNKTLEEYKVRNGSVIYYTRWKWKIIIRLSYKTKVFIERLI